MLVVVRLLCTQLLLPGDDMLFDAHRTQLDFPMASAFAPSSTTTGFEDDVLNVQLVTIQKDPLSMLIEAVYKANPPDTAMPHEVKGIELCPERLIAEAMQKALPVVANMLHEVKGMALCSNRAAAPM